MLSREKKSGTQNSENLKSFTPTFSPIHSQWYFPWIIKTASNYSSIHLNNLWSYRHVNNLIHDSLTQVQTLCMHIKHEISNWCFNRIPLGFVSLDFWPLLAFTSSVPFFLSPSLPEWDDEDSSDDESSSSSLHGIDLFMARFKCIASKLHNITQLDIWTRNPLNQYDNKKTIWKRPINTKQFKYRER